VRQICKRYGQHYNTGSLFRQFGQVAWRIVRHSFPSRPRRQAALTRKPAATLELGGNEAVQQAG
jgi:linoleoyl-CoA desaturase